MSKQQRAINLYYFKQAGSPGTVARMLGVDQRQVEQWLREYRLERDIENHRHIDAWLLRPVRAA